MRYEDKFKSIFYGVVDIVTLTDNDYNILMVNRAFEKLLEMSADECIGEKCYKIISKRETPCEDCPLCTQTGDEDTKSVLKTIGQDNVSITRHPIYDQHGIIKGIFEIGHIITKRLKMEREVRHQGRLKIMGELVSSIVHEIKNPLAGIGLMTVSIMERLDKDMLIYHDLESILQEVQRLEKFLKNLTNFSKPDIFKVQKSDIHTIIDNTLKLMKSRMKSGKINIRKKYDLNIPNISIGSSEMKQVFFNILLNSIAAMPGGGEIIITTSILIEKIYGNIQKYLQIIIQDNGVGIKKEYQSKIFDPFFSKSLKGTGLGLSIVYKIMEIHRGSITVKSKEGEGTTVILTIPFN